MYAMGLDIGYSQIKIATGDTRNGAPHVLVRPAAAGPRSLVSDRFIGGDAPIGTDVMVQGVAWVAGGETGLLQNTAREMHADYTTTDPYRALFYAALRLTGQSLIDVVVTGLPVSHFQVPAHRARLEAFMTQDHLVAPGQRVKVMKTVVLPQPAGAYLDLASRSEDTTILDEGRVVVLDVGHFSADWAVFERGQFHNLVSGSSLKAMSKLLDVANRLIAQDHEGGPGLDNLEDALRHNRDTVLVFGERVAIAPYLATAARELAPTIATQLRAALRDQSDNVDLVLLVGGGARLYREAAQQAFPKSRLETPDDVVTANARGFWAYA
ncbi:MAG: ParM/StbA family protein [Acidiferrobacter sp.]